MLETGAEIYAGLHVKCLSYLVDLNKILNWKILVKVPLYEVS
jgi:hypothetical protein